MHDVAARLAEWTQRHCPALECDREAVLFGAATHDVSKAVHLAELSGPGDRHEETARNGAHRTAGRFPGRAPERVPLGNGDGRRLGWAV
ncbi:hypothetical protein ACIPRD_08465 [Streptomyces sp. NPDC090108]|uniref:hypothetical protein n=1 Tax=Streptomyces sp. NPDC090108 TaxID=3365947 RepID=UPI00380F2A67